MRDHREDINERLTSTTKKKFLKVICKIIAEKKLKRNQYIPFYTKINFIG